MNRIRSLALVMLLVPATAAAQRPAMAPDSAARAALEARVLERFIERTSAELALSAEQMQPFETLFRTSMERRRQFARESAEARRALAAAITSAATSDADLERRLAAIDALRQRDHERWLQEQRALAELLTPRQRALYTARWLSLQDNIRDVMTRRTPRARPLPR